MVDKYVYSEQFGLHNNNLEIL